MSNVIRELVDCLLPKAASAFRIRLAYAQSKIPHRKVDREQASTRVFSRLRTTIRKVSVFNETAEVWFWNDEVVAGMILHVM